MAATLELTYLANFHILYASTTVVVPFCAVIYSSLEVIMAQFQRPTLCCCRKVLTVPSKSCEGGQGLGQCRLVDIASASNFHCFKLRHFHLDLRLNFAVKEITGWQVLELVALQPGVQTLVLDTHPSLLIHSIDCKVPGTTGAQDISPSLTYRVDPFTDYGSSLNISLPAYVIRPHRAFQITVRYTTTDGPAVRSL